MRLHKEQNGSQSGCRGEGGQYVQGLAQELTQVMSVMRLDTYRGVTLYSSKL